MRKLVSGLCAALLASVSIPAFANTTTTNYSLNKPTVGADSNNWGALSNANWDSLDSIVFGIQGTANAACPKAGCTFTGGITGTTGSFSSTLGVTGLLSANGGEAITGNLSVSGTTTHTGLVTLNGGLTVASGAVSFGSTAEVTGAAGANAGFGLQIAGTQRWLMYETGAESGSNTGSNLLVCPYSDAGTQLSCPLGITRSTSLVTISNGLTVGTSLTVNSGATVSLPAGSIANAALAGDVGGTSTYSCGDATHTCHLGFDAKGLMTGASNTAIAPDTCANTTSAAYCENAEGYIHEWGVTGSIAAGGSVTITLPLSCVNNTPIVQVTASSNGTNGGSAATLSLSQFTVTNNKSIASGYAWASDCN